MPISKFCTSIWNLHAIAHADGNMIRTARLLGISERTLLVKRKKYGLK
ncbi:helix-turn-helix domain-containing protein [Bacteroides acidifaciens]|jgi:DNA-binding NtrC family response regulator